MKVKKIIIAIVTIWSIISINTRCYAKYVFEYTLKAVEIITAQNIV